MAEEETGENSDNRLLTGWKAIAARFGRDERTVRRWAATRDLPVRRAAGDSRGPVYAYAADLDRWLVSHKEVAADMPTVQPAADPAERLDRDTFVARLFRFKGRIAAICAACLTLGFVGTLGWRAIPEAALPVPSQPVSAAESLYLDGLYHLEARTSGGIARALGLFSQAVAIDPRFAKAYVGMADAYNLVSQYTPSTADETYPKAKAAAKRAIALDPGNAAAHAALAFNAFYGDRDIEQATSLFRKAIALDPDNARAHHWYALVAMQDRDFDVALREIAIAQRLDPRAPSILANKGLILFHAGQTQAALDVLSPLAQSEPSLLSPHAYLATIYLATGRDNDFLHESRLAATISGNQPAAAITDAAKTGFANGGRQEMLNAMFIEQKRFHAEDREPAFKLALTAAMLGDKPAALDFLEQSIKRREQDILGIRLEPALAGLRDDARFKAIVVQAGFKHES